MTFLCEAYMATRNDITGDKLISQAQGIKYDMGWDRIFGAKKRRDEDGFCGDSYQPDLRDDDRNGGCLGTGDDLCGLRSSDCPDCPNIRKD